jgi:protein MpaA
MVAVVAPIGVAAQDLDGAVLSREVIGTSVRGRPIEAIRMGDPRGVPVLVVGVIHGREAAGLLVTDALLAMTPPAGVQLWIVPNMNPDGVALNVRGNANRVDLNRNFPYRWAPLGTRGFWQFAGTARASEPETLAMMAFIRRINPQFGIWYHQDLNVISPSTGLEGRLRRTYARLTGMPMRRITGGTYTGVATAWQRRVVPDGLSMVVELPGVVSVDDGRRHAESLLVIAAMLREAMDRRSK